MKFSDSELIERMKIAALVDKATGRQYDHDLLMDAAERIKQANEATQSTRYLHIKSGKLCDVLQIAANESDTAQFAVYRDVETRKVTVIPMAEFFDGRFIEVIALETVTVPAPTPEYSYALHAHAERWSGPFNSIVEAITEALGEYVPDQDKVVYVGENEPVEINCDWLAEEVIERIQEQAEEQVGEVADSIGPFDETERKPLADAIESWVNEHAQLTCWKVEKSKAYRPGDVEYEAARAMTPNFKAVQS